MVKLAARRALEASNPTVRFQARLRDQVFHGANELWRVECADGLVLTLRTSSRPSSGDAENLEFEFSSADAVPVRQSEERV